MVVWVDDNIKWDWAFLVTVYCRYFVVLGMKDMGVQMFVRMLRWVADSFIN